MALFFFLLFVSGFISEKEVWCVGFLRLIRGLLLWGIQFLFFLFLRISHRELLLLVQGLPQIPRNRSGGYPLLVSQFHCLNLILTLLPDPYSKNEFNPLRSQNSIASPHLSRYIYKLFPRGERKLQDEYVLPGFPNSFSS